MQVRHNSYNQFSYITMTNSRLKLIIVDGFLCKKNNNITILLNSYLFSIHNYISVLINYSTILLNSNKINKDIV